MPSTPSAILADALGTFGKAANHAIATAEKQAAAEVARANGEAEEARRERDNAVEVLSAIRLEKKEWQRRVDGWKTSVDKSDMTIEHQNETIAQLREEANQWKGQLLRYEDTARREAQDWKEQYLRAEQERVRLAARVDELVTEQLAWNTRTNSQNSQNLSHNARPQYSDLSSGPRLPRRGASTAAHQRPGGSRSVPPVFDDYQEQPPVPRKVKAASTKPISSRGDASPQVAGPSTSRTPKQKTGPLTDGLADNTPNTRPSTGPRGTASLKPSENTASVHSSRVIRRVQAVIEVPVKEESDDEAELLSGVDSEYEPTTNGKKSSGKTSQKLKIPRRRSSAKSKWTAPSDDDDDEDEDDDGTYKDPPVRRRIQVPAESEDELAIGVEDNQQELYSAHRVIVTSEKNTPQRQRGTAPNSRTATSTKKRKLDGDASASRGTASKIARK